jgi:SnoaL-like domain
MEKEGTMDDPRLERLWAINEIQQLAYRYAFAFDSRDVDELASLWAETERSASPPEIDIHTVRDEFDQWLYGLGPTVLAVCNHIIEIDDADNAHGSVYCLAQIDMGERFIDQSILYQDRYVRRNGRWLFEVRRHMLWFGQPRAEHPLRQEPANWPASPVGRGTLPGELASYRRFQESRG